MIRRWSRVDLFNFYFIRDKIYENKFSSLKLLKTVNYKKSNFGFTKFNRRKLAIWKRKTNWLFYTDIIKFWIKDYNLFKSIFKSQFSNTLFANSTFIYDFNYIKKRNPLRIEKSYSCFYNSFTNFFFFYFYKKFSKLSSLNPFTFRHQSNNVFILTPKLEFTNFDDKKLNILIKSQKTFASSHILKKIKINFFFYYWTLKQILYSYKILIFFLYVIDTVK